MSSLSTDPATADERRDALVGRLFEAAIATFDVYSTYLGIRLGLYEPLAAGARTSTELAESTGTHERYVREWLEHQATTGVLEVDDPSLPADARRFRLPAGHDEVLLNADSLAYFAPVVRMVVAAAAPMEALLAAFRSGSGVPYPDYGEDMRDGIGEGNRVMFINMMASWLAAIPDVDERLRGDPPARVADLGSGSGWSSIAIARAYPRVSVDGYDSDPASIARARENAAGEGLSDRVSFSLRDASDVTLAGRYDLVTAFETLHDMARPIEALATMRRIVAPGGAVVIADERVGDAFGSFGDLMERYMYGFSVLHCLPASLADPPSVGTGSVMRPSTLSHYAQAAGFERVDVLPIENDYWRFYRPIQ